MTNNMWDIKLDYHAVGDGVTDDADAIQEAFDYIFNHPEAPRGVYFPSVGLAVPGSGAFGAAFGAAAGKGYNISHPIFVRRSGTRIIGSSQTLNGSSSSGSRICPTYRYGPTIVIDGGTRHLDLASSLVPGPGYALRRQKTWAPTPYDANDEGHQWFDLRDAATLELNGLSAITVEFFIQAPPTYYSIVEKKVVPNLDGWIISSYGRFFSNELKNIFAGCFVLQMSNGVIVVDLQTNLGLYHVEDNVSIADNLVHHVAFDYDGANLCLYRDGIVVDTILASGTLKQHPAEGVNFGRHFNLQPGVLAVQDGPLGVYDSIHISKIARYHGLPFTKPITKFAKDPNNTLCLMNFDRNLGPLTRAETKDGDFWAYLRGLPDRDHSSQAESPMGWDIEGISIQGAQNNSISGIFIGGDSYAGHISRVSLDYMRIGIMMGPAGNSYDWRMAEVNIRAGGGRYGYLGGSLDGLSQFDTCWFFGGMIGFFSQNLGKQFNNCFWQADALSMYPLLLHHLDRVPGSALLNSCHFSTEGGIDPVIFQALLAINPSGSAAAMLSAHSCNFEINSIDAPYIAVGGVQPTIPTDPPSPTVGPVTFENCSFHFLSPPPPAPTNPPTPPPPPIFVTEILKVLNPAAPPTYPILFHNCKQSPKWTKWSTTIGATTAIVPGLVMVPFKLRLPPLFPQIIFDASLGSVFIITLTADVTSSELINASDGQEITFIIRHGGHSFAAPTGITGFVPIPLNSANPVIRRRFVFDGTSAV